MENEVRPGLGSYHGTNGGYDIKHQSCYRFPGTEDNNAHYRKRELEYRLVRDPDI